MLSVATLSIDNGWILKDGEPTYLIGFSPSAMFYDGAEDIERLQALPPEINYMRTWLEAWDAPGVTAPFVIVDGKADLEQINPDWLDSLGAFLDASAQAGVVQELTLFNPWGAREHWESHWWNPDNNLQGFKVTADSLYTLGNPAQALQVAWMEQILEVVDQSQARKFVIIEIDNELFTGGAPWRDHFIGQIKARGSYIVSTIATYADDFDPIASDNDIIGLHGGGSGNPADYVGRTLAYEKAKPVIFNELYPWDQHSRESQRAVFWSIFMAGGMLAVDYWGNGRTTQDETLNDLVVLARFIEQIDFAAFQPDAGWLVESPRAIGAQADHAGGAYMAYFANPSAGESLSLRLPRGDYLFKWIDPASGHIAAANEARHSGQIFSLTIPADTDDIVLLIQSI